jgi:hypothetical protein
VLVEKAGDVAVLYDNDTVWIGGRAAWALDFQFMNFTTQAEVDAPAPNVFTSGMNYAYSSASSTNR